MEKICKECKNLKDFSEFYNHPDNLDKKFNICKSCFGIRTKKYKPRKKVVDVKRKYNLSEEQIAEILYKQNNKCKICYKEFINFNFCVDHDHSCCQERLKSCGKCVRGFLCNSCNCLLGYSKDNENILIQASNYLRSYKEREQCLVM